MASLAVHPCVISEEASSLCASGAPVESYGVLATGGMSAPSIMQSVKSLRLVLKLLNACHTVSARSTISSFAPQERV